jgi:hypothetical protein
MTDSARGSCFAFKARGKLGVFACFAEQGLDRDPASESRVQRLVDDAHGATADLTNDLVLSLEDLSR